MKADNAKEKVELKEKQSESPVFGGESTSQHFNVEISEIKEITEVEELLKHQFDRK